VNEKAKVFYAKMRKFLGAQQSFSFFASLLLGKVLSELLAGNSFEFFL